MAGYRKGYREDEPTVTVKESKRIKAKKRSREDRSDFSTIAKVRRVHQ